MNKKHILLIIDKSIKHQETNFSRQNIISTLNKTSSDIIKNKTNQAVSIKKTNEKLDNDIMENTCSFSGFSNFSCED